MNNALELWMGVAFVVINTQTKMCALETIATSLENSEAQLTKSVKIPVIFHNLCGYDSHFIMQQIGEIAKKHAYTNKKGEKQDLNINAIPNNMEKYMAFMLGNNHLHR